MALHQDNTEGGEGSAPPFFAGLPLGDFPLEQSHDKTPRHAFDQARIINGQKSSLMLHFPTHTFQLLKVGYIK